MTSVGLGDIGGNAFKLDVRANLGRAVSLKNGPIGHPAFRELPALPFKGHHKLHALFFWS